MGETSFLNFCGLFILKLVFSYNGEECMGCYSVTPPKTRELTLYVCFWAGRAHIANSFWMFVRYVSRHNSDFESIYDSYFRFWFRHVDNLEH